MELLTVAVGLVLAAANGANDNPKGVASLLGSGTASYRRAMTWATFTTALGSVAAVLLAQELILTFSGRGLVPSAVASQPAFATAVAAAAGMAVLLATRWGFPISTTHGLVGGLVGAGLVASPSGITWSTLGGSFVLPLLLSPAVSLVATAALYPALRAARGRLGVSRDTCVCVGGEVVRVLSPEGAGATAGMVAGVVPSLTVADSETCAVRYGGTLLGVRVQALVDGVHYLSAGAVSFARGLNDTPKIAALLWMSQTLSADASVFATALLMAGGAAVGARRIATTMSSGITSMSGGQGLTANLVTSALVIASSRLGLPVSTTHVSCGALFGIGFSTGQAHTRVVVQIVLAWVITLPLAAALGAALAWVLS